MRRRYVLTSVIVILILLIGLVLTVFPMVRHMVFSKAPALVFESGDRIDHPRYHWIEYSDSYLQTLRTEFQLEALVEDCTSDLERVQVIAHWVYNLWDHDGDNAPAERHPLFILREVQKGERFRCVEYGVVISGSLQALGIPARHLSLKTADVETRSSGAGHVVTEAYLRDLNKWVFIDGQWNVIPFLNGIPLNAVELQRALANNEKGLDLGLKAAQSIFYRRWIAPYLYYFDVWANGQHIMLGPSGVEAPTVFQGKSPINVSIYTHDPSLFYTPPVDLPH